MAERQWNVEQVLYKSEEQIVLTPQQEQVTNISNIKSDAKALLIEVEFLQSSATAYNFNTKGFANLEVVYKNTSLKKENYFINFNRDIQVSEGVFKNLCILELKGNDIESIKLKLFNKSEENLTITAISVIPSMDVSITQIAKVLEEETIAADILNISGAVFSNVIFTQLVQTNLISMIDRNSRAGDIVNFIKIDGWTQDFYTITLTDEVEQLIMEYSIAGTTYEVPIFYAIIEGENAYKYYTTKDPRDLYPDMSDTRYEEFKVKVRKGVKVKKMGFDFRQLPSGTTGPVITLGTGTSTDPESLLGKGVIYKDETGSYHLYYKQDGSGSNGIIMDDTGVYLKGVVNDLEYLDGYDDGFVWKYKGDPRIVAEEVFNSSGGFAGLDINGVFKPFTRRKGSVKDA